MCTILSDTALPLTLPRPLPQTSECRCPHLALISSSSRPHLALISSSSRPHLVLISPSSHPHLLIFSSLSPQSASDRHATSRAPHHQPRATSPPTRHVTNQARRHQPRATSPTKRDVTPLSALQMLLAVDRARLLARLYGQRIGPQPRALLLRRVPPVVGDLHHGV